VESYSPKTTYPYPIIIIIGNLFTGGFFNTENQEALAASILTTGYYTH
jgi:hypothetical protein